MKNIFFEEPPDKVRYFPISFVKIYLVWILCLMFARMLKNIGPLGRKNSIFSFTGDDPLMESNFTHHENWSNVRPFEAPLIIDPG